jgi:TetR/AcrR family transcriptional repressor of mexJK operon
LLVFIQLDARLATIFASLRRAQRFCIYDTDRYQYSTYRGLCGGVNSRRRLEGRMGRTAVRHAPVVPLPVKRAGRPRREIAAQLSEQILEAAETLFLEQGYGATTIEQVASRIGATKRTVYVRFSDKAGLFHAVAKRVLDGRRPDLRTIGTDRSVDERLGDMALRVLSYVLDPDVVRLFRVVTTEAYRFPELNRMIEEQAAHGVAWAVGQMLEEEVRLQRLVLDDTVLATRLLLSLITGAPTKEAGRGVKPISHSERRRWVQGAIALFLDGARAPDRGTGTRGRSHQPIRASVSASEPALAGQSVDL